MGEYRAYSAFYVFTIVFYVIFLFCILLFSPLKIALADFEENSPEILNISINDFSKDILLIPNKTKTLYCEALIADPDNDSDILSVNAIFYDKTFSPAASSDNNNNYKNNSCELIANFEEWNGYSDSATRLLANCTFEIEYYANPGNWSCLINATDESSNLNQSEVTVEILEILSIGLPETINYGIVEPRTVSQEQFLTIENFGNVEVDIEISAYAKTPGDNISMDCPAGITKNISMEHERYNLIDSTPGALTLEQFNTNYKNISSSAILEDINLSQRQNDELTEATIQTYWRIYAPQGIAGICEGNIEFTAVIE